MVTDKEKRVLILREYNMSEVNRDNRRNLIPPYAPTKSFWRPLNNNLGGINLLPCKKSCWDLRGISDFKKDTILSDALTLM